MGETIQERAVAHVVRRPGRAIGLALLVVALFAAGAGRLGFDPRYDTFFDADDPQLLAFEHLRDVFAPSDAVVFIVDPGAREPFSAEGLALLDALTEAAWRLPFTFRVDSPLNYPHVAANGDEVAIGPLVEDPAELDATGRSEAARIARRAPEIAGRLVERDGRHVAVAATVILEGDPLAATERLMSAAREVANAIESDWPGAEVHLGGIVAMNHAFSESSLRDSGTLLPLMLGLMIAGLIWLLRSVFPVLAIVGVMLCAVAGALGVAGWAGVVLTTPAAIAPIVIVTVALADGVHLVLGQRNAIGEGVDAVIESMRENAAPIALTTASTAVGFLSMNFSAVPPFRDLGNLVAIGVVLAGVLSLTLLPAVLCVLPEERRPARVRSRQFRALAEAVTRRRARVLIPALIAAALVLPGVQRLAVNDDFVAYFDADLPFRQAAEIADEHLAGLYEIEYQLAATGADGIHDPAFLAELAAFTAWLRAQPETAHVLAWTDVLGRVMAAVADAPADALPETAAAASQFTLLYELSLPLGLDATNMLAPDYGSVRQLVTLRNLDSSRVLEFEARAGAWLAANAPTVDERHGGINLMFAHISERNVAAMVEGNLLAVVLIAALLAVALRSLALAGVSLLTNLVPVAAAFGLWGWFAGDLGLALSTAFGMTLGIVVDDTVHLLARHRRARAAGHDPASAARHALERVGPALLVTSVILVVGFGVLATSSFAINGLLARFTVITVVLALAFDLLVLPALLAGRGPQAGEVERAGEGTHDGTDRCAVVRADDRAGAGR